MRRIPRVRLLLLQLIGISFIGVTVQVQAFQSASLLRATLIRRPQQPHYPSSTCIQSAATNETELLLTPPSPDDTTTKANSLSNNSPSDNSNNDNKYPPTPSYRTCLAFALPALGIYICPPLMSLIDAAFVGRLSSSVELAALGPASSISDSAPLPLLFLSIAATNLIAKSVAAGDDAASARVSRTSIGMGSLCGLALGAVLYAYAAPISVAYCGGSVLAPACRQYVAIRALALPFVVMTTIAQAICIGTKDTRTPMISVALAAVCNLLGDLVLVKWLGQGIAGAAWATSASQILAAGLLLRMLRKRGFLQKEKVVNGAAAQMTPTLTTVKQLLSFVPFLFIMMVKVWWHNACTATAASLGGVAAAAHTALLSVCMVCMVLGDVGSSLSQAFLPAFEGSTSTTTAGSTSTNTVVQPTFDMKAAMPTLRQLLKCTLSISAFVTVLAAIVVGIFGGQITSDPAVLAEMRKTLPWIMAALSFHGSAVTLEGLLLSRKMFRPLSVCYTVLAITVAGFSVATRKFGWGLAGVWATYVWFCASRVITFASLGGLLRPRQWLQRIRKRGQQKTELGAAPVA